MKHVMRRAEVVVDSVLTMDFGEDPKVVDLVLVLEVAQDTYWVLYQWRDKRLVGENRLLNTRWLLDNAEKALQVEQVMHGDAFRTGVRVADARTGVHE